MSTLRWGILGTGNIAQQFSAGVNACHRGKLTAVGSREEASATTFAAKYSIPAAHGSYDALLADPNVDAIYLSLPNSMHHEWTIKSLNAGKHVLCEKPFANDTAQSEEMFDVAQKTGKVLVEAFMYRSHPQTLAIQDSIRRGAIGKVKSIHSNFCYRTNRIDGNIRFSKPLAGGALMDVGCYCLSFSRLFGGGEPIKVFAASQMHESGVDELTSGTMQFASGVTATFTCGMRVQADNTAYICGDEGYIAIGWPWKPPASGATFTIARSIPPRQDKPGGAPAAPAKPPRETRTIDLGGDLYGNEADDFAASVLDSAPPRVTRDDTIGNMRVLDEIRRQIGLHF